MRAIIVIMWVVLAPACVATEPETPSGHPANASVPGPPSEFDTAVLRAGFDPFERYEPAGANAGAASPGHDGHSGHGPADAHGARVSEPRMPSDAGEAPAAASYTCPMHPEIVRPAPGRCPKCGMKLVPKKAEPK